MGLIFFVLFFLFAHTYWLYKFMRALWKTDSMIEAYKLIMLDLKGIRLRRDIIGSQLLNAML
jgi:hypothetical protein